MPLSDDIRALRAATLAELVAAHDYYTDTVTAWRLAKGSVVAGRTFAERSVVTGTVTTQVDLVARAEGYIARQLTEATFQQFLAVFEAFFFDFLRLWITAYPQSLGDKQVGLKAILDAPDKDAIVQLAVTRELVEVMYDRPAEWFAYLERRAKLGCPTPDEIGRVAEAKAARDMTIHNRGYVNRSYLTKAGAFARYRDGERVDITEPYHRGAWELLGRVVADISDAALEKLP